MGSKTVTKTNEVQSNKPPEWAAPGLAELGGRISSIIPTMPGPKYEGDFVAQPVTRELAMPRMLDQAATTARQMMLPALGALGMASGQPSYANMQLPSINTPQVQAPTYQQQAWNPQGLDQAIMAATNPVRRQLMEQVLPSIQSSGIESGAYGGTRNMQVLPGMAMRGAAESMGDIASGMAYQDYANHLQREAGREQFFTGANLQAQQGNQQASLQGQGMNVENLLRGFGLSTERGLGEAQNMTQRLNITPDLIDTVMRMQTSAVDMAGQAGAMERGFNQSAIENQLAAHDYAVRYPFQGLDVAASLLGNLAQPWGTRTTNGTTTQSTGGLAPIMGGLMGAGMMAMGAPGGLGGISSLFSRAPSMAGLGMGQTGFSDRRLKSNIKLVKREPDGLGIYSYDIFGERQYGVMADEVETLRPWALGPEVAGFKTVDYGRL